jgi:hypothetical protein
MRSMRKLILLAAVGFVAALAADPALAQFAGGGGDAPFRQGMSTMLNWAFIAGVAIALFSFLLACVFLFMRNLIGFAGGVLGVVIGGALMANAPALVQSLTGLNTPF